MAGLVTSEHSQQVRPALVRAVEADTKKYIMILRVISRQQSSAPRGSGNRRAAPHVDISRGACPPMGLADRKSAVRFRSGLSHVASIQ
jgi:hypothetical protein